jgi:hypothetical protein
MNYQQLPLFPLNTVLFPGAPLTLHIFEERYREMVATCLEESAPFGVVLIRQGSEIGAPAIHHDVGTIAQINASVRLDDGRYLIATAGQQRFRTQHTLQWTPYIQASVLLLPEEDDQEIAARAHHLQHIYDIYWNGVAAATGVQSKVEKLPQTGVAMTYYLAHRLQVTNERKQHWLETDVSTRAREIAQILQAEIELLPRPSAADQPPQANPSPWTWSWN